MLRVKIELLPHGIDAEGFTKVLDTVFISNDGTAVATGPNEGGVGNYEVHDNETLAHLHTVDYPRMYACGFIKGVERGPEHRIFLAEQALGIVQESRKLREEPDMSLDRREPPTRIFGDPDKQRDPS